MTCGEETRTVVDIRKLFLITSGGGRGGGGGEDDSALLYQCEMDGRKWAGQRGVRRRVMQF